MKRLFFFVFAALLCANVTWSAQVDYTNKMSNAQGDWTNASGTHGAGVERYNGNDNPFAVGDVLYQTITDLPNGYYEVKFYAWENFSNWNNNANIGYGDGKAQVFANVSTEDIYVIKNTGGRDYNTANTYALLAIVTDGSLKYGIKNKEAAGNWAVCRPISLTYLGAVIDDNTDLTSAISNPSFETGYLTGWSIPKYSSDTQVCTPDGSHATTGADGTYIFNTWWQGVPLTQEVANLPSGKYKLTASIAGSDADKDAKIFLIGNGTHSNVITIPAGTKGAFSDYDYTFNLTGTSTTIGIVGGNDAGEYVEGGHWWYKTDNFRLTYLGITVEAAAVELPSNGDMTANTWYYFDIATAGNYNLTTSTLGNISYTTDGAQLVSNASTSTWASSLQNLTAGRFYVKSSSAQTLTVTAQSYTYVVGTATADKVYIQTGQTVTIEWPDHVTNDGGATFELSANPSVTFGGNPISFTSTTDGFSFEVPTVTAATDYVLSIPAGTIGYSGHVMNEAATFTLKTPAILDCTTYLKVDDTEYQYLTRGHNWGTRAYVDKYGVAVNITTDKDGYSKLQFVDTRRYLNHDSGDAMWCDKNTDGDHILWEITKTNGGKYRLHAKDQTDGDYVKYDNDDDKHLLWYNNTGNSNEHIIDWALVSGSEYKTAMTALKNTQAATAAATAYAGDNTTYASLNGVTSVSAMETAVASLDYYTVVGGEAPTSVEEKYQGNQPNPAPETVYSNTLTIPAPGLYRFSMQAFYRAASNANTQAMHTANVDFPPVVLFFGDAETQIKSLYDEQGGSTAYVSGDDAEYNGKYYANCMNAALMMFQEGKYKNDVWFYAPAAGEYTYGVKYMGFANDNMQWFIYSPEAVTVIYYGNGTITKANGVVTVLGNNELTAINNALTSDIAVLNIEGAVGLSNVGISTTNNANLLIYANNGQVSNTNNVIINNNGTRTCTNLVLTKRSNPFFVPIAFTATNAKYTVASSDLAGGKYATLMIPFAANSIPTGTAYTLDQGVTALGGEVKATEVVNTTVPANSPVLITSSGQFSGSNVSVPAFAKDATFTSGELTGVYSTTPVPVGSYVLQNHASSPNGVAFYLVADTQPNVGPFRAYIKPQSSNAKALRVIFINGDDTTSIGTPHEDGTVTLDDAEYYTLGGARLSAPQKGLNVVKYSNGTVKKIFVK